MPGGLFVEGLVPSPPSGHRAAALPSFAGGIELPLGPRGDCRPAAYYPLAAAPIFFISAAAGSALPSHVGKSQANIYPAKHLKNAGGLSVCRELYQALKESYCYIDKLRHCLQ